MTDTTRITLGTRYAETGRVLLWSGRTMWGDDPDETTEFHEARAKDGHNWHAGLAVMRRALDDAEAAGIDIYANGEVSNRAFLSGGPAVPVPGDVPDGSPSWRAGRYLIAEVRGALDNDLAALAALPYDVRDHRVTDDMRENVAESVIVGWQDAERTRPVYGTTSLASHGGVIVTPDPVAVTTAYIAPAEDDEPVSGEHPPVTAHDLVGAWARPAPEIIDTDHRRAFPPAPAAVTDTPEEQARKLLEYHTRRDVNAGDGCYCGWNVWGASFAQHLVATLAAAGLMHGTRERQHAAALAADVAEEVAAARTVQHQRDEALRQRDAAVADLQQIPAWGAYPAGGADPGNDALARRLYALATAMRPDVGAEPTSPWDGLRGDGGARTFWRALAHLATTYTTPEQQP